MPNVKDILLAEQTLFKDETVFNPQYVPEQFLFREPQLKELSYCVKPAIRGGRPANAILAGRPATGKTTAIKFMFHQISEITDRVVCVHINCQINDSPYRIFSALHKKVIGFAPAETGKPLSGIYEKIFSKLSREKKSLVIALDDMNYLVGSSGKVIYDILRVHEIYNVTTAVFVTMQQSIAHKLDDKVRSIFQPRHIDFPLYKQNEIFDILKGRAAFGFYPGVLNERLLQKVAFETANRTDLRFGIELLKHAGMEAEEASSRKIEEIHIEKAIKKLASASSKDISAEEKLFLTLLEDGITSGSLYKSLSGKKKIGYTTFYRIMKRLEAHGLVRLVPKKQQTGGKTTLVYRTKLST